MRPTGIPQKGTNHPAIILIGISTMEMMDEKMDGDDGLIKSQSNKTKCIEKIKIKKVQKKVQGCLKEKKSNPSKICQEFICDRSADKLSLQHSTTGNAETVHK